MAPPASRPPARPEPSPGSEVPVWPGSAPASTPPDSGALQAPSAPFGRFEDPLPGPFAETGSPPIAPRLTARVVAAERVVGLGYAEATNRLIVVDSMGGITTWHPREAPRSVAALPMAVVTRAEFSGEQVVVCGGDASPAWASSDAGAHGLFLPVACGEDGRRTLALVDGAYLSLADTRTLLRGETDGDGVESFVLPFDGARGIAALGRLAVVFTPDAVWRSEDAGETFVRTEWPERAPLEDVREAMFVSKSVVIAVGQARPGGAGTPIATSRDGGKTWRFPTDLPRGSSALAAVASSEGGRLRAVPLAGDGAFASVDLGRTWTLVGAAEPGRRTIVGAFGGFVSGHPDEGLVALGTRTPPPLLRVGAPWRDAVFTHPAVGVAVTRDGHLQRTLDGGATWFASGAGQVVVADAVARTGQHGALFVGPSGVWSSPDAGRRVVRMTDWPTDCRPTDVACAPEVARCVVACEEDRVVVVSAPSEPPSVSALRAPEVESVVDLAAPVSGLRVWSARAGEAQVSGVASDGGVVTLSWAAIAAPPRVTVHADERARSLAPWVTGLAIVDDGAEVHLRTDLEGDRTRGSIVGVLPGWAPGPVELRRTQDGSALWLTASGLWRGGTSTPWAAVEGIAGGTRLVPRGEGGWLVLSPSGAWVLEPR